VQQYANGKKRTCVSKPLRTKHRKSEAGLYLHGNPVDFARQCLSSSTLVSLNAGDSYDKLPRRVAQSSQSLRREEEETELLQTGRANLPPSHTRSSPVCLVVPAKIEKTFNKTGRNGERTALRAVELAQHPRHLRKRITLPCCRFDGIN